MNQQLSHYDAARLELAAAKELDEVKGIMDKTTAIAEYARRANDHSLEIDAGEIRVRAQRKLGELLREKKEAGELRQGGDRTSAEAKSAPSILLDAGISLNMSKEAQDLASVPEPEFEQAVVGWRESKAENKTKASASTYVRKKHPAPPKPKEPVVRAFYTRAQFAELPSGDQRRLLSDASGENAERKFVKQTSDAIEWAQWSWNPITGCLHDCPYCYARDIANQERMAPFYPNKFEPTLRPEYLFAPRSMHPPKEAETDGRYRNVFTCSMADLFGRWVPAAWIEAVLREMRNAPQWQFLCLTKFPKRMSEFEIPANVWMGTTVDLQARVPNAERAFAKVKAGVRWLSVEPLLEPLRFTRLDLFDWIVIGGASRSNQTPEWMPPFEWVADLVAQATAAGIPIYMKTNLGISNRIVQLPKGLPVPPRPMEAPKVFHYLGRPPEPEGDDD